MTKLLAKMTMGSYVETRSSKSKVMHNFFQWTNDYKKVFQNLKQVFMTLPVLVYYDFELEIWIKIDFSDFVMVGMLLQIHNRVLRLITYFSKKLTLAECNYIIYNKNFLAIVKSFKM